MFSIQIKVDDSWITPVYEHVHHGRMLSMFEDARLALVDAIGFPNDQLIREGKVLVITKADVAYKREVKRGTVQVTCDSVDIEDRTITLTQRIINDRQKVAVEAQMSLMFMDSETRRGMLPPSDFSRALKNKFSR